MNTKKSEISELLLLWLLQSINNNNYNVDCQEGHFKANRARSVRVQLFTSHTWMVGILSESAEEGGESTTLRLESQQEPAADTCLDRQTFSSSVRQILHIKLVYMNKVATTIFNHFQYTCFLLKKPYKVVFRTTVIFLKKYLLSVLGFVLFDRKNTQENHFTLISMACSCVAS